MSNDHHYNKKNNNTINNTNNNNNKTKYTSLSYTPLLSSSSYDYNNNIICMLNSRDGFLRFY